MTSTNLRAGAARARQAIDRYLRARESLGWDLVATLLLAALYFGIPFRYDIINPRSIEWMLNMPFDLGLYLTASNYYRFADWAFPITYFDTLFYPIGGTITLADGLPLFAVPYKLLDRWLPPILQYFGLWLLLCVWLQAFFAKRILRRMAVSRPTQWLGTVVLMASLPIVFGALEAALWGHWLLLAGFLLALRPNLPLRGLCVLGALAPWVHPYLFLMVMAISGSIFLQHRRAPRLIVHGLIFSACVLTSCWLVGYFSFSETKALIGDYMTDVFTFIIPHGTSSILPNLPALPVPDAGFGYLGLGGLALLAILLIKPLRRDWRQRPVHLLPLLLLCLALGVYAIGTRPLVLGKIRPELPYLHEWAMPILERARVTGRFLWPLYYYILLWGFRSIHELFRSQRVSVAVACAVVAIQAVDVGPWLFAQGRRAAFSTPAPWPEPSEETVRGLTPETRLLAVVPAVVRGKCKGHRPSKNDFWRLALFGAEHRLKSTSDFKVFARVSPAEKDQICKQTDALWRNRKKHPEVLFVRRGK